MTPVPEAAGAVPLGAAGAGVAAAAGGLYIMVITLTGGWLDDGAEEDEAAVELAEERVPVCAPD